MDDRTDEARPSRRRSGVVPTARAAQAGARRGAGRGGAAIEGATGGPAAGASEPPPASAAELVAALWRREPPDAWAPGHVGAGTRGGLCDALTRLAAQADVLAGHAPAAERPGARLLAETARAVVAALRNRPSAPEPVAVGSGALAAPVRLRLARMERWLAARAAADPGAGAAADLCLWVVEHLEADGG